ncbi:MAG: helix-turn-helix domain-containing protein [Polyangiaceae bacterium]
MAPRVARRARPGDAPGARREPVVSVARRRATAIAGRAATLDALDHRVVALVRDTPRDRAALVLDLGARALRLPSGRHIDVSSSDLALRLLEVLARAGGRASKELLARQAWNLPSYHPHRDDKRLQVAIHRVRQLLDSPELIARDGDGYRVTVPVRIGPARP